MDTKLKQLILNICLLGIIIFSGYYIHNDVEKTFMFMGGSFLTSSFTQVPLNRIIKILYKYLPSYLINYDNYFILHSRYEKYNIYKKNMGPKFIFFIDNLFKFLFEEINNDEDLTVKKYKAFSEKSTYYIQLFSSKKYDSIVLSENDKLIIDKIVHKISMYTTYFDDIPDREHSIIDKLHKFMESSIDALIMSHDLEEEDIQYIHDMIIYKICIISTYSTSNHNDSIIFITTIIVQLKNYKKEYSEMIKNNIRKNLFYDDFNKKDRQKIEVLMGIFKEPLNVNVSQENVDDIITRLNNFLSSYDKELKNNIIKKILIPYTGNIWNGHTTYRPYPLFLCGSPGTGKTKFVEELAVMLDSHLYKFNDNNSKSTMCVDYINEIEYSVYIKAIYETRLNNKNNCIIFIDEFDKYFNNVSRNDLNISKYLTFFNNDDIIKIDDIVLPKINMLIIASGNKLLKDVSPFLEPLHDRFVIIPFPKLTRELKKHIVYTKFIIKDEDPIINKMIDEDKNDGIRALLNNVSSHFEYTKMKNKFKNTSWSCY